MNDTGKDRKKFSHRELLKLELTTGMALLLSSCIKERKSNGSYILKIESGQRITYPPDAPMQNIVIRLPKVPAGANDMLGNMRFRHF